MCIADMAAGRRTLVRTQTQNVTIAAPFTLLADPRRLRLMISCPNNQGWLHLSRTGTIADAFNVYVGSAGYNFLPMRVEDYGLFLLGDITFISTVGDTNQVYIAEVIADRDLDIVIQEEVG